VKRGSSGSARRRASSELGNVCVLNATRRTFLAPRRIATLEASQFHPAEGRDRVVACGVSARRSSTFKLEEHPERAHPMYYASYRQESADGILCNSLCGIHPTRVSRFGGSNESGIPRTGFVLTWGTYACLQRCHAPGNAAQLLVREDALSLLRDQPLLPHEPTRKKNCDVLALLERAAAWQHGARH